MQPCKRWGTGKKEKREKKQEGKDFDACKFSLSLAIPFPNSIPVHKQTNTHTNKHSVPLHNEGTIVVVEALKIKSPTEEEEEEEAFSPSSS